jgi:hypothetical protein
MHAKKRKGALHGPQSAAGILPAINARTRLSALLLESTAHETASVEQTVAPRRYLIHSVSGWN